MPWPKWIKDHTWQWVIGTFIAFMAIIIWKNQDLTLQISKASFDLAPHF